MTKRVPIRQLITQTAAILTSLKGHLISVESCTGGGLGYFCTSLPGASSWYECGHIPYQNAAKLALGVSPTILDQYGAVSTQCAEALACTVLRDRPAGYYALAITGIAGPDGGSPTKPVGTICFAWAQSITHSHQSVRQQFNGDRAAIRQQAMITALKGLHQFIARYPPPDR